MKKLKLWQAGLLIVAFLGTGGGVYGARQQARAANTAALPANTQLAAVTYGNVTNAVSASGSLAFAQKASLTFGSAGTVQEVKVKEGESVKKGQALARIDTAALERALVQARLNLSVAETNLKKAQSPYAQADADKARSAVTLAEETLKKAEKLLQDARVTDPLLLAARQAAVDLARANLESAQGDLATLEAGPSATDVARARAAVDQAAAQLQKAYDDLAKAVARPANDPDRATAIYLAQADVQMKSLNLESVQNNLDTVLAGPSALAVARARATASQAQVSLNQALEDQRAAQMPDLLVLAQRQADVDNARVNLLKARDTLETVLAGADTNDLGAKQLQYDAAKAALADVETQLASATMTAPYDGIVGTVNIVAGQKVGGEAVAIVVVDTSSAQMTAVVNEVDISRVKQGQRATLSVDALAGAAVNGAVSTVSVLGRSNSGVVSYPITIQVTAPAGVQLREGMSATASLLVQQASNVLVVPNRAIGGSANNPVVSVVVNGKVQQTSVKLGLSDDSRTEVVEGLKQGDMVLVSTTTSQQRFFGGPGGGPVVIQGGAVPGVAGGRR